ncbi:MAG TPA: glycosyltransferase family 9 protein [Terriglobia bacterium]|nr:glycosyltransferase family 9 protein [Terriglobia bacterium]
MIARVNSGNPTVSTVNPLRFLVVRACAIGDFVLHLPALRALTASYPTARFTLVGYPETLALARVFLPVEAIHSIETPPWSHIFETPLNNAPFDAAWVWMKNPVVADNLKRSGIREVFHASPFPASGHAAEHLLHTINLPAPEFPDFWDPGATRIVLHPGSGSVAKVWPRFRELARLLPEAVVLLGPCESVLDVPNECLSGLPLAEVAEALRHCRLFIGNDSGITHIAAYWGTPTIALFGATDPRVWGPIGRRVTVLEKPSLDDISIDDVRKLL